MSQISVLGFTPCSLDATAPYPASSSVHWSILLSPDPNCPKNEKPKPRFFHSRTSTGKPAEADSTLFDMHNHQLRQQQWPIPLDKDADTEPTPAATETTTTLNATTPHPLQLIIRITTSTLPQSPSKLSSKLQSRLQATPTYGPEEDWLRSALSAMHHDLLEHGFDVDGFIDFAGEAAKEYALYEPAAAAETQPDGDAAAAVTTTTPGSRQVLDLDYTAHIRSNARVKALLSQQQQGRPHGPSRSSNGSAWSSSSSSSSLSSHRSTPKSSTGSLGSKWFGFRVAPSPTQVRHYQPRDPWQRRDDPYAGMM